MIDNYTGNYLFDRTNISLYAPDAIGVYYCGTVSANSLIPHYIGRATSIQARQFDHLNEDKADWYDVTHFGFRKCSTISEAIDLEASEIKQFQPKYNTVGKYALGDLARALWGQPQKK